MAEVGHDDLIKHLRGVRYIVINTDYGGFGLSREGLLLYLDLAGIEYTLAPQPDRDRQNRLGDKIIVNGREFWDRNDIERDDPALVAVVRRLGSKANGEHAKLKIVGIPADVKWYIEDNNGIEWISEHHRTWQ